MKIGQYVRIKNAGEDYDGKIGVIIHVDKGASFPYRIRMDDGNYWFTTEEVEFLN